MVIRTPAFQITSPIGVLCCGENCISHEYITVSLYLSLTFKNFIKRFLISNIGLVKETLRLGRYDIPLLRLPNAINDVNRVYEGTIGIEDLHINDIAKAWNLSSPSSGGFYKRLNSLVLFGFIESTGKARYKITPLTKDVLSENKNEALGKAFFNVPLWSKLYERVSDNPPSSIFIQLNSITHGEPLEIKKYENKIREWYLEDLSTFPNKIIQQNKHKSYNVEGYNNNQNMQHQQSPIDFSISNSDEQLKEEFGVLTAKGIASIKITDEDTLELAKTVLDILLKKIKFMNIANTVKQTEPTKEDVEAVVNDDNKESSPDS